nr:PEPxxWA-CTERM sorting domain-containing protein [Polymorphobacter sp.]
MLLAAGLGVLAAVPAQAAFTLDFEGMGSLHGIREFYNGGLSEPRQGAGDNGRMGTNYGVSVSQGGLAVIDLDRCGPGDGICNGLFANNPSGKSVMGTSSNRTTLNVAAGFTGELSFYHVTGADIFVSIYEGLGGNDGLSAIIAQRALTGGSFSQTCTGNPTGAPFCSWSKLTLQFNGTARSVDFGLASYDDMTFGAPGTAGVPEPANWAMLIAGFGLVGAVSRRLRWVSRRRTA